MKVVSRICLAGLLMPFVVQSQVVNGDFAAGTSGWQWTRGQVEWGVFDNCFEQMSTYNVSASTDTPSVFDSYPAVGRVGIVSYSILSDSHSWVCKRIEQTTAVPTGTMLTFDAKLGEATSQDPAVIEPVQLWVEVVENGSGLGGTFLEGYSKNSSCEIVQNCPGFVRYTVDVSQAWGRNVTLRFRTKSESWHSFATTYAQPSPAFVDNVAFVQAPTPGIPRFHSPSISGNNHSVSWDAIGHSSSYVLEQRVDNGTWVQVYDGPTLGWTMMSAPSGDYHYRVKACGNGCSAYSSEVLVSVPQATPGTPTANIVGRSFALNWSASSGAVRYVLEQKGEDGLWAQVYDGSLTQSTLYNIAPGIYGYRVKACGNVVCSSYSAEQYFTAVDVTPVIVDYVL